MIEIHYLIEIIQTQSLHSLAFQLKLEPSLPIYQQYCQGRTVPQRNTLNCAEIWIIPKMIGKVCIQILYSHIEQVACPNNL